MKDFVNDLGEGIITLLLIGGGVVITAVGLKFYFGD